MSNNQHINKAYSICMFFQVKDEKKLTNIENFKVKILKLLFKIT